MSDTDRHRHRSAPGSGSSPRPPHLLSTAWVALGLLVVAVPLGRAASTWFLEARGYDPVRDTEPPGVGFLSFLVLVGVVLPPALLALWAGLRAWQAGHRSAVVVLVVAGLVSVVVLLGLPVYLSRLLGWPLVIALVAGLAGIAWFGRPRRWGRAARIPPR